MVSSVISLTASLCSRLRSSSWLQRPDLGTASLLLILTLIYDKLIKLEIYLLAGNLSNRENSEKEGWKQELMASMEIVVLAKYHVLMRTPLNRWIRSDYFFASVRGNSCVCDYFFSFFVYAIPMDLLISMFWLMRETRLRNICGLIMLCCGWCDLRCLCLPFTTCSTTFLEMW